MTQKTIDWDIEAINANQYEAKFTTQTKNHYIQQVFRHTMNRAKKGGKRPTGDIKDIDEFEIPTQYLNLLKTIINKPVNNMKAECKADNFHILTNEVAGAKFKRNGSTWDIVITVTGNYTDNR